MILAIFGAGASYDSVSHITPDHSPRDRSVNRNGGRPPTKTNGLSALLLTTAVLTGCAGMTPPTPPTEEALSARALALCEEHPAWTSDVCRKIVRHQVSLGMTQEQVQLSWGKPDRINRTSSLRGDGIEQWVYGRQYLYFEFATGVVQGCYGCRVVVSMQTTQGN